jgi:protein SMG6
METFQECGVQMLREFRALLQQTPLPVNQTRLLQLLALNMFAVSNTQLKGKNKNKTKQKLIPEEKLPPPNPTLEIYLNYLASVHESLTDCSEPLGNR